MYHDTTHTEYNLMNEYSRHCVFSVHCSMTYAHTLNLHEHARNPGFIFILFRISIFDIQLS